MREVFVQRCSVVFPGWRNYVPQPLGGGTYCFWWGSRRRRLSLLSALYLLNQQMDFNQTCTDALLGKEKTVFRFWWPWTHFQSHFGILNFLNFDQKSLSAPYHLNRTTDSGHTWSIITLVWFKYLIRFWWLWSNFQGHRSEKTFQILTKKKLVCTLSLEPNGEYWSNLIYCNFVMV